MQVRILFGTETAAQLGPGKPYGNRIELYSSVIMHELSLCENIRQVLEQQAPLQHYHRVKTVWLEIGRLSGVEPEAIRFAFEIVMQGSIAERARLEIVEVPGEARCTQCLQTVEIQQRYDECPRCGGYPLQIQNGEQMRIKELEVE
jgi:hydrogenase nickel incorporation protein HypA/HybF